MVSPPNIVSAVTAVSASNGVGIGLISPSAAELTVAFTFVVSVSKTLIVTVAWLPLVVILGEVPLVVTLAASSAKEGLIVTVSLTCQPSPPCSSVTSKLYAAL